MVRTLGVAGRRAVAIDPAALVLLRRSGLVAPGLLGVSVRVKQPKRGVAATVSDGLLAVEGDLLARGFLTGARLRGYLAGLSVKQLTEIGIGLITAVDRLVGADVPHVPLFRHFPRSVPVDTYELYVRRVFTLLLQEPEQPCVLCGSLRTVTPVSPCAHLVCGVCWDGSNYSACPICHRRIDPDDPFLRPTPLPDGVPALAIPRRARVLELADDLNRASYELIASLLGRQTPLSPQDQGDLSVLLDRVGHGRLEWLPAEIPARETKALMLARLLADPELGERHAELLGRYVSTATDALRLLHVRFGGDVGLIAPPPKRASLPRPLRRAFLLRLNTLPFAALVDDLHRNAGAWLRVAENLHPFEQAHRHPRAALAFAVLRGTTVEEASELGRLLLATADEHRDLVHLARGRLRVTSWGGRLEHALRTGADAEALALLAKRPGELARRLVAVAHQTDDTEALQATLSAAVPEVSPGVLIAALGALRAASWSAGRRLYFPRGGAARLWAEPDRRPRLDSGVALALETVITEELLGRASILSTVDEAIVDVGLADLIAPFTERTASAALVSMPRGSSQPLPAGRVLRLFLHWTQPEQLRIDLDLSVAMFDATGSFLAWCDYTRLRYGDRGAIHSGDLTSAPAPLGASEFIDLDVPELRKRGVRYLTMIVFSFNDVPFEEMTDAFAGLLADPDPKLKAFVANAVEQRFDLTGSSKIATPIVIDLQRKTMRWIDATLTAGGDFHSVERYSTTLGLLSVAADRYFAAGTRVSLWEVACWHAAARAAVTHVRHPDGALVPYRRQPDESLSAYASRLAALGPTDDAPTAGKAAFAALIRGDIPVANHASVYALHPAELDANYATLLTAADLITALAP